MRKTWLLLIVVLLLSVWALAVPKIPVEDFFRNPQKTSFQLSPDGAHVAFLQPWKTRLNIHVQKLGNEQIVRVTDAQARDILGFMWANNARLVYVQDKGGDENYRAYAVNLDGSNFKTLTPFEKVRVSLIDRLKHDDEHMLISLNKRDRRIFDVYRINIVTGELTMIAENPGNISGWITDHNGKLRVATTTDGVNSSILYRDTEAKAFKTVVTTNFKVTLQPLFFTFDNKHIYAVSNQGRDKTAIVKFDIANNKELEVIYQHPQVDVHTLLRSDKRKIITGVTFTTWKREYCFFDPQRAQLQQELERRLPGYEILVTSRSKDENKCLVRTYSDKSLGSYYFYDCTTDKLRKLTAVSPWLKEEHLADMQPITYKARDGLTIHGYLTLPRAGGKNLPAIVLPHGGPWYRDRWGFRPEVQFLANRGYAVLQVNFRGSTGYGRKFWEISFKQWGKTMQDDITDGVKWLIEQKIADPDRIGIYGGSYGGYATLAGLTFTPDLYACGVDYVGVSNIFSWLKAIPPYWHIYREMLYEMVGHPQKDKELLREISPLFHVDKIKAPLFIAQGANDPRVPKAESDQMVAALKKRGIDVPYMVRDNEGHGFLNEENRFAFYRAMEKFLHKHLQIAK